MGKVETLSGEDMKGDPKPVDLPVLHVSQFTLFATNGEVGLFCTSSVPAYDDSGTLGLANAPVAYLTMPKQSVGRLAEMLAAYVENELQGTASPAEDEA